ncbi:ETC complex I subunit [Acuticoccus yangtzensis]|uniref:ETC complex I subunit n=1 Tax=Acuticoccus yangtzensis TaxID=1443441 RepID=UPI00094988FC|nr:ETC complex I subunit [Acuticoccus yangtzensis]ORE96718.1 ETC complex I subunit region [Stappia sp. 22II-S9-Z10]
MRARIFKPARNAMQSGTRRTKTWRLELQGLGEPEIEPLMGWTSGTDTRRQIRLDFPTREAAIAYAHKKGLDFWIEDEKPRETRKVAYSDNFRGDRAAPWTH